MKTKTLLSAILGCGLMALTFQAAAQGNTNNPGPGLSEKFDAKINLLPTPDAPAGAKGKAQLRTDVDDNSANSTIRLQTTGLQPGDYDVRLVLNDASTVDVGTLTIVDPDSNTNNNGKLKSDSTVEIPDSTLADVSQIVVSSGGVDLLVGDLADPTSKSKSKFSATVPITPGEAAPNATGTARLKSSTSKGVQKNKFNLTASGVPEDTLFTVVVDGTEVGTAESNSKGKVMVKSLPPEVTNIHTVQLLADGVEALRADF